MKHLYEVDCGVTYWVAADTIRQAIDTMFQCWKDEGWDGEDEIEGFKIDKVSEERAKKLHFRDDGLDIRTPMNEAAAAAKKPTVIACSE